MSNFSGEKVLNIKSDGTLNSFEEYLEVFAENRQEEFVQRETVKVDLIDNLIDFSTLNGETKVVIKIDVQGHEIEALNGASKVLDYTDLVLCEMSFINEYVSKEPSFSEVCSILRKHKIYPLVFQEYGKQLSNHIIECDVLFVHQRHFGKVYYN